MSYWCHVTNMMLGRDFGILPALSLLLPGQTYHAATLGCGEGIAQGIDR